MPWRFQSDENGDCAVISGSLYDLQIGALSSTEVSRRHSPRVPTPNEFLGSRKTKCDRKVSPTLAVSSSLMVSVVSVV
jgi:hypothetical protein